MTSISQHLNALHERIKHNGHRHCVVLSGQISWATEILNHFFATRQQQSTITIGLHSLIQSECISNHHVLSQLGRDWQHVIYNAHEGFDPDAFCAISGTLCAGGLFFLLTPEFEHWPHSNDKEKNKCFVEPHDPNKQRSFFIDYIIRNLQSSDAVSYISPHHSTIASIKQITTQHQQALTPPFLSQDQQQVVTNLASHFFNKQTHAVVTADRGRGKSSALALFLNQICEQQHYSVAVTAPRRSSVDSFFALLSSQTKKNATIQFYAPDDLALAAKPIDLLLVDEAAAIPNILLSSLLDHYQRIVFSSTTSGYEGSGQGFLLRFLSKIKKAQPNFLHLHLQQPIRWQPNCPFEYFVNQTFLLTQADYEQDIQAAKKYQITKIEKKELLDNLFILRQVYTLLASAHYQTRPYDLRYLLDSPNLSLYVHAHNKIIHAVLLVADEGQLDETISNDIHYGRRRLKGHHLPQIMSFNLATKAATRLQFKRIVRIAVLPTLQGRGLGSQLLRNFLQQNEDVDFIGAIFGATAEVTRFWTQNVFTPVHLGFKSEARSGAHSVLFLKAISSQAQDMVRPLQSYFQQTLKTMKSSLYRDIDEAVMQQLTSAIPSTTGVSTTGNTLHSFAYGHRSFLESYVLLNAYYSHQLKQDKTAVQAKFNSNQQKLMNVLLNFSDFQTAVTDLALSGKKQFIDELRKLTRFCLEHNY